MITCILRVLFVGLCASLCFFSKSGVGWGTESSLYRAVGVADIGAKRFWPVALFKRVWKYRLAWQILRYACDGTWYLSY